MTDSLNRRLDRLERSIEPRTAGQPRTLAFDHERYAMLWREHPISLEQWKEILKAQHDAVTQ
jgi:hypothetical protein